MKPMKQLAAVVATLCYLGLFANTAQAGEVWTPWFGAPTGTFYGGHNPDYGGDSREDVIRVEGWSDSNFIYGLKFAWRDGVSSMYGPAAPHGTHATFNVPATTTICRIEVDVDTTDNVLRGMIVYSSNGTSQQQFGYMSGTVFVAFGGCPTGKRLTGMETYEDQLTFKTVVAVRFRYLE